MILVIDKDKSGAETCAEIFNFMGILAYGASPSEAMSEMGIDYRAVLVSFPERIADCEDFVYRLRKYAKSVPIFALAAKGTASDEFFDAVFNFNTLSSTLIRDITEYCRLHELAPVGCYRMAGIEASADSGEVFFKDKIIPLTKTEKMILRYLIRTSPSPKSPKEILKHAFKPSRAPLVSSVRTHVHQINRKLSCVPGAPKIVARYDGYVIATPILLAIEKEISGIV